MTLEDKVQSRTRVVKRSSSDKEKKRKLIRRPTDDAMWRVCSILFSITSTYFSAVTRIGERNSYYSKKAQRISIHILGALYPFFPPSSSSQVSLFLLCCRLQYLYGFFLLIQVSSLFVYLIWITYLQPCTGIYTGRIRAARGRVASRAPYVQLKGFFYSSPFL